MSINFPFSNGIGPGSGGCHGQGPANCRHRQCNYKTVGPDLAGAINFTTPSNVSFRNFTNTQQAQVVKFDKMSNITLGKRKPLVPLDVKEQYSGIV